MLDAVFATLLIAVSVLLTGGSFLMVYRLVNAPVTGGE